MSGGRIVSSAKPLARRARLAVLAFGLALAALAVLPQSAPADALSQGKKAMKEGRLEEAIPLLREAVRSDPNFPDPHIALAQALERRRHWEESLAEFQQASKLDERSAEARRGQGNTLEHLGRLEDAAKAYEEATKLDRRFPDAALGLGDVLVQLGRYDQAVAVLQEGTKWGVKTQPLFYEGLGRAEAARGNLKDAEVYLLKARELAPAQSRYHRALGDLYMQKKVPELAVVSYTQAISLDPDDLESRFAMAHAKAKLGLFNEALEQYRAIIARDSTYELAYKEQGDIYLRASDSNPAFIGDALFNLEKYARLVPGDPEGAALLARAYMRVGKRDEAYALVQPLAISGKLTPDGHLAYGRLLYERQDFGKAVAEFALAQKKLEDFDYVRYAHALWMSGVPDAADSIYQARWAADSVAGKDSVKASDWVMQRARMNYQLSQKDTTRLGQAIPLFQRKIELDPKSDEAYYLLGLSYMKLGRSADAAQALEKAAELAPDKADRHFWLAANDLKLGRQEETRREFELVARLDSTTNLGAVARQRLAFYRLVAKDWSGAINLLEKSKEIDPKQAQTWVWLGQAYQNSGQRGRATDSYRKALELDPKNADARKGLEQLKVGAPGTR